jgi:hypothetical protein
MSKTKIHVGVNITPNELTEQLFLDDKLPKNYEVRSYDKKGFQTMLKMSKPTILDTRNIDGICDFNSYLQPQNQEEPEFLVILKRKFAKKP